MRHSARLLILLVILSAGAAAPLCGEDQDPAPDRTAAIEETLRLLDADSIALETRIEALERIAALHSDSAEIWAALGELRVAAGLDHEALTAFERSVRLDSTLHGSWHWIGVLNKRGGRNLPTAAEAFQRSMEQGGPKPIVLNELAVTHAMMGEMPKALGYWQEAIAADPDWGVLYANAIKAALALGQRETARDLFLESLEARRFEPIAVLNYTESLVQAGRGSEALDAYAAALAVVPGEARIRYYYAATLREEGREAEAALQFRRVIADAEGTGDESTASVARKGLFAIEHPRALQNLIEAENLVTGATDNSRRGRRNLERAVTLLDPVIAEHPTLWEPRLLRGIAHRRLGDNNRARGDFEAVLREVENQPNALVNIALIERDGGNRESAVRLARRAAEAAPRDPQILINAGLVLVQSGQCEEARRMATRLEPLLPPADARELMAPLTELIAENCR